MEPINQGMQNMALNEPHRRGKKWRNAHAYHTFDNNAADGQQQQQQQRAPPAASAGGPGAPIQPAQAPGARMNSATYQQQQDMGPASVPVGQEQSGSIPSLAIPSLAQDRARAQESLGPDPLFKTFENACPPPACSNYAVLDQGISSPEFTRLTMYNVPATEQLRASTQLPMGLQIHPFAKKRDGQPVAVADFTEVDPPRCRRCRTYINPSMLFVEGGTKFVCNMCQFSNPVQADYYQPTDASNRRIDWEDRPELAFGSYDLEVPSAYWKDEVQPSVLQHLFIIDVSADAVKKELPKLAVEAIRATLYGENSLFPPGAKVGIMTFDRSIHFYNLNPDLAQAQMMVMSDIEDAFVPIDEGLFVDPQEARNIIEDLLDRIDVLFAENKVAEPAFGAALEAAYKALEGSGGKVSATLSALPTWGPGNLFFRDGNEQNKAETEKELLISTNQYYLNMGKKYATAGIGMDLFVFPTSYIDLANTGEVCRASGGQEFFYPRFAPERDGRKFIADFCKANWGEYGTQALLKVRCSNGLQVEAYYGNFHQEDNNKAADPFIGVVGPHTTVGVLFNYDGKLDTKLDAHFQVALLYTSSSGKRRVRVHNILASVTEQQYKPVINFVDVDSCMAIATRNALSKVGTVPLKEIRFGLNEKIVDIFASYRRMTGANQPSSQLLMPISLRSLMIYFLSLQKTRPLRGTHVFSDGRVHALRLMNTLNADELSLYLYPRIIGLHNYRPDDCEYTEHGNFIMPINIEATAHKIEEGGVYLAYNGQTVLIWFHKQVSPLLLEDLFGQGITNLADLNPYLNALPELDTDINRKTRNLLNYFAQQSGLDFLAIQLARQSLDGAEYEYHAMMIEDRNMDTYNYHDYVAHIHRQVKINLENKNSKSTTALLNDTINLTHGL
jgi:protein transport protein SEC24